MKKKNYKYHFFFLVEMGSYIHFTIKKNFTRGRNIMFYLLKKYVLLSDFINQINASLGV